MQRKITLKTAKKKPGTISRSKVRRVIAEVYAASSTKSVSSKAIPSGKVLLTRG